MTNDLKIQYVPLSKIEGWPRNPKRHNNDALMKSIRRFGFTSALLQDKESSRLVGGHGRVESLGAMKEANGKKTPAGIKQRKDGEWLVPVITLAFKDAKEAEAYLLADNRISESGGWDDVMLAGLLKDMTDEDLFGVGFAPIDIQKLIGKLPKLPEDVEFPEFDESVGDDVAVVKCPFCEKEFPAP